VTARSRTPEPPYCWLSKDALRKIEEHLDGDGILPFAILVYLALSRNASDRGTEEFTTLQSHLARLAGNISTRTVRRALPVLREIGVIDYTTPKLRGPITFTLLSVRTVSPNVRYKSPSVRPKSPNVRTGKKTAFLSANRNNLRRTEKEDKKNNSSRVPSDRSSHRRSRIQLVDDDHLRELRRIYRPCDVDKAAADCKAWLLTPRGAGKAFTKRRLQTFLRDAEPLSSAAPAVDDSEEINRHGVDSEAFQSFLAREYPAGMEKGWTAENAPESVVRNFTRENGA
jgi:hypothetical protein